MASRETHTGGKVRSAWRGMRIRPSGEKVGERGTDEDRERANPGNWNERTLEGRWVVPGVVHHSDVDIIATGIAAGAPGRFRPISWPAVHGARGHR